MHAALVRPDAIGMAFIEREEMTAAVLKGMRWTYLGTGMTHPNFLATVEEIKPLLVKGKRGLPRIDARRG